MRFKLTKNLRVTSNFFLLCIFNKDLAYLTSLYTSLQETSGEGERVLCEGVYCNI